MRDWLGRWRRRTRVRCCGDGEVGVVTGKEKRGEEEAHWLVYVSLWCPVFCAKLCQYGIKLTCTNSLTEPKYNNLDWAMHSILSRLGINVGTQEVECH